MLEDISIDGEFELSQTGIVKLRSQSTRKFEIIELQDQSLYIDRFYLPFGSRMDWRHTISEEGEKRIVRFAVSVAGPTSFILAPIMKAILQKDMPVAVHNLLCLSERLSQ